MLVATVYTLRLLLQQTREIQTQTKQLNTSIRLETFQRVYEKMIEIDLFFVEHPDLKAYFYQGKEVEDENQREEILCMAETMVDMFYNIFFQRTGMPSNTWRGWERYINHIVRSSPIIHQYLASSNTWYDEDFLILLANRENAPGRSEAT
jgi:hypothetical protein